MKITENGIIYQNGKRIGSRWSKETSENPKFKELWNQRNNVLSRLSVLNSSADKLRKRIKEIEFKMESFR